jgi:ribosomal protein S18 acetylase RimI-like enzyme
MNVSFGVEYEFDVIRKDGYIIKEVFYLGRLYLPNWDFQDDHTAAVELRTPILTSLDQAVSEISQQFAYWTSELPDYAPYPVSEGNRSLGQHIHIGRPNRRLREIEARALSCAAANVYPFLASLQAQPVPSGRGLTSRYTYPIWLEGWDIPSSDHFCEISRSHNGTVEFRLFDANIPQLSLINAWLLTEIAKRAFSKSFQGIEVDKNRYRQDRELGLRFGLKALEPVHYLTYLNNLLGNIRIPNFPFLKEILYLAVRHRLNPFNIMLLSRVDRYRYFRYMFTNPSNFLEFFRENDCYRKNEALMRVLKDAEKNADSVMCLEDLIELARRSVFTVRLTDSGRSEVPIHSRFLLPRSTVAKYVEIGEYLIRRINEVYGMTVQEVADRVAYLIAHHGDNMLDSISAEEIIRSPVRYYVLVVYNRGLRREDIMGAIGVNMGTGEISHLVVDRRYRRLGIATRLLDHVREECNRPVWGYVRQINGKAINLLQSLGFKLEPAGDGLVKFTEAMG